MHVCVVTDLAEPAVLISEAAFGCILSCVLAECCHIYKAPVSEAGCVREVLRTDRQTDSKCCNVV